MRALWCFAVLLILPLANAGTASDPEISDGNGDTSHPDANRDLVAAWIDDELVPVGEGLGLAFNVKVRADFYHTASAHAVHERFRFGFVPDAGLPDGAVEAYVNLRPSLSTATGSAGAKTMSCQFGTAAAAGGSAGISSEVTLAGSAAGSLLTCVLSLDQLPGFDPALHQLRGLYVSHQLVQRGPLGGTGAGTGDQAGVNVLRTFDRAPDSGAGRDWGAPAPAAAAPVQENVSFPVVVEHMFTNATNVTYILNWTSLGGDMVLQVALNGTGSVSLQVLVGNATLENATLNGTGLHNATFDAPAGNGTIVLRYEDFAGNVTLLLDPMPEPEPEAGPPEHEDHEGDPEAHNATGNETLDGGAAKDTPGMALPMGVLAVGLAVAARRRRW